MEIVTQPALVSEPAAQALLEGHHGDPFAVLGMHAVPSNDAGVTLLEVRTFRPDAMTAMVYDMDTPDRRWEMVRHPKVPGFFELRFPVGTEPFRFAFAYTGHSENQWVAREPYGFPPLLSDLDAHFFGEGQHWRLWQVMGARRSSVDGSEGLLFRVWAPNARRVSVVGNWNAWDGRIHVMRKLIPSGIWELFVPGLALGELYKFEVLGNDGSLVAKSDPFAFYSETGVKTASIAWDIGQYAWGDDAWMEQRRTRQWHKEAVSVYEVHPGSWRRKMDGSYLSYRELAEELIPYVLRMGFTHIELMPVSEFPFDGSWGYQVTGYFAPTSRFGNPDDFRYFVDECHRHGLGVLLDWVPGHFPRDGHGLARFDGTALYEHADPRQGAHQDWGTLIFNYGRNEVRNFLIANGLFWLEEYHLDGLRVDAVASMLYLDYSRREGEWIANQHGGRENLDALAFLRRFNELAYERCPGIMTIAEESTAWPGVSRPTHLGGLGFGLKWNMGWMHDTLNYFSLNPLYRRYHQGQLTFSLIYAFHEHFVLVLSHDEVVHGKGSLINKMPGDEWQQFANLRLLYGYMWGHPGKKLLFMGGEFGQRPEWRHDDQLQWWVLQFPVHHGVQRLVVDLNRLYRENPALWELDDTYEGFEWIDFHDADNCVVAFLRKGRTGDPLLFVLNGTPVVRKAYRLGVPGGGYYREILNTDSQHYGGSNIGNGGGCMAKEEPFQGRPHSIWLTLPPLAMVVLRRD